MAQTVQTHSSTSKAILDALAADAGYGKDTVRFYEIAQAGFNFVDDQCSGYFQTLQELEAKRNATKQGLGAFAQTTNAVLAVTGAGAVSMAVTAQAFGLGQNLTDVYANSFLFSLPPSRTQQFVAKIMSAYRGAAAQKQAEIDSGPAAYQEIRGYLQLCMPVTIEGMLSDQIADTTAEGVAGPGSTVVVTGSRTTAQQKARIEATVPIASPDVRLVKPQASSTATPGALNKSEASVPPALLKQIQAMVCVDPSGHWDSKTRVAITDLFKAAGQPRPQMTTTGYTNDELPFLQRGLGPRPLKCGKDAVNDHKVRYENVEELANILS